jgi:hypothetical protein
LLVLALLGLPLELELEPLPIEPDELLPIEPEELLPLEELEPDLLKCASHSEREIWPSLLVSTAEKFGVVALLLPEAALGVALPDLAEPLPAPWVCPVLPAEVGDWLELLLDLESPAATASPDRTKSAAAVVTVTVLSI